MKRFEVPAGVRPDAQTPRWGAGLRKRRREAHSWVGSDGPPVPVHAYRLIRRQVGCDGEPYGIYCTGTRTLYSTVLYFNLLLYCSSQGELELMFCSVTF